MFPKIVGFPPNHPCFNRVFHDVHPSILGVFPLLLETPIEGGQAKATTKLVGERKLKLTAAPWRWGGVMGWGEVRLKGGGLNSGKLGGANSNIFGSFTPKPGEMIQFDGYFFKWVETRNLTFSVKSGWYWEDHPRTRFSG